MIQRGIGQVSTTNHFGVIEGFLESVVLFFGQYKYTDVSIGLNSYILMAKSVSEKKQWTTYRPDGKR